MLPIIPIATPSRWPEALFGLRAASGRKRLASLIDFGLDVAVRRVLSRRSGISLFLCLHLFDLGNQFEQLLALARAHIQKPDPDMMRIVDRLNHAAKPYWHSFQAKLCLHSAKDTQRKALIGANAAPACAEIYDAACYGGRQINQKKGCLRVHGMSSIGAALLKLPAPARCRLICSHGFPGRRRGAGRLSAPRSVPRDAAVRVPAPDPGLSIGHTDIHRSWCPATRYKGFLRLSTPSAPR